ncbi:DMT family transporter [Pantoea sp. FN060301]|uniref:DMT family transporter n=1 Tax=Pantoea sp. FN060301 TaxID=3420380 RepID=UPI003D183358
MDYSAVFLATIGFSLKAIFIKLSLTQGLTSDQVMSLRMIFAVPFFVFFFLFSRSRKPEKKSADKETLICSVLYFVSVYTNIYGLAYVPVGIERLILFLIPLLTLCISFIFQRKRFRKRILIYCFMSIAGAMVSFLGSEPNNNYADRFSFGIFLIFISALSYAAYMIFSADGIKKDGASLFNSKVMIIASLPSIFIPIILHHDVSFFNVHNASLIPPLCLSLFSTVLPSFFMSWGIKNKGPEFMAAINSFGPFLTLIAGYLFLGESISFNNVSGMLVVIVSITFLSMEAKYKVSINESFDNIRIRKKKWNNFFSGGKNGEDV